MDKEYENTYFLHANIVLSIGNFIKCSQNKGLKGSLPWLCLHFKERIIVYYLINDYVLIAVMFAENS